ncbi:sensor domain-containing protein [Cytobacillus massiliigabonensis]|uniref:sensor domain-containing protein n=1 Tax=Cytobacillus massiliigabonensis TaxID=1871011 RepID=UPI0015E0C6F3|nr:EAL domain-containing protein [Cytobacillus massiliigabonensis]
MKYTAFYSLGLGIFAIILVVFARILDEIFIRKFSDNLQIHPYILHGILLILMLPPLFILSKYIRKQHQKYIASEIELQQYKLTLESSTIAAYIISDKGFLYISPAFAELFGYSIEEFYEKKIGLSDLLSVDFQDIVSKNIKDRFEGKDVAAKYQIRAQRKDGVELFLDLYPTLEWFNGNNVIIGNVINITEKHQMQIELEKREKALSTAQKTAGIFYWEYDTIHEKLIWSPPIYELLEISKNAEASFELLLSKVHPDDRKVLITSKEQEVKGHSVTNVYRILKNDGSISTIYTVSQSMLDENGQPTMIVGTMQDITKRLFEENRLERSEIQYKSLFENNLDTVVLLDLEGYILSINDMGVRTFGYKKEEILQQIAINVVSPEYIETAAHVFEQVLLGESKRIQLQAIHKEGHLVDLDLTVMPISVKSEVEGVFCIAKDVTEQKKHMKTIEELAYQDHLTGLPNRRRLLELMTFHLDEAKNNSLMMGIMYIDLDRLKFVNDNLGHVYGDELIIEAGKRILHSIRAEDTLARVGGDEFVIITPNIPNLKITTRIAKRIMASFKQGFIIDNKLFRTSASIGISAYPTHGTEINELVSKADKAMYYVKSRGKDNFKIFESNLSEQEERKFILQTTLESSLKNNDFYLLYQPRMDVKTGRISTSESLARWKHPELGVIHPSEFIKIAEETGDIVHLGEWVLSESLRTLKQLHLSGKKDLKISVNVSVRQLYQSNFDQTIKTMLQQYQLRPCSLELEVTESMLINDDQEILNVLKNLRALGVCLSIDDFGTGNSSISYLKRLSVDVLKIDRSFITGIPDAKENAAITSAMINLAHDLNIKVVSEGIETEEELAAIIEMNTDEVQGYFISYPLSKEGLFQFLKDEAEKGSKLPERFTKKYISPED